MNALNITEADTVQMPMIRHAADVGWIPIPPQDALARRGGTAGLLFRGELEAVLRRFNPWLADDAVRGVVERLELLPPAVEGNREALAWLRGERQWYDETERRHRFVTIIDFERPGGQRPVSHLGVDPQAAGPQGQPGRRDVPGQRSAGRHRREQEP